MAVPPLSCVPWHILRRLLGPRCCAQFHHTSHLQEHKGNRHRRVLPTAPFEDMLSRHRPSDSLAIVDIESELAREPSFTSGKTDFVLVRFGASWLASSTSSCSSCSCTVDSLRRDVLDFKLVSSTFAFSREVVISRSCPRSLIRARILSRRIAGGITFFVGWCTETLPWRKRSVLFSRLRPVLPDSTLAAEFSRRC